MVGRFIWDEDIMRVRVSSTLLKLIKIIIPAWSISMSKQSVL